MRDAGTRVYKNVKGELLTLSWRYLFLRGVVLVDVGRLVFFRVITQTATRLPAADAFGAVFFDSLRGGM